MKMIRSRLTRMHSLRLTVVRRSSSMMPIFSVFAGRPNARSTVANSSTDSATSSGPCCFGLTMYMLPLRLLRTEPSPFRSCSAASVVTTQSRNVSAIGWPAASVTASVSECAPTCRTSSKLRPGSLKALPFGAVYSRSGLRRRSIEPLPLATDAVNVPRMMPHQLR